MLQPKDTGLLNGYKNKTHIYAVYKRPISDLETHTNWKWGHGERYSMQIEILKRQSSSTYIRKKKKKDLKMKTVTRQREILHHDQGINPRRRYNNCKYICTQHRGTSVNKVNVKRHKRRNSQ